MMDDYSKYINDDNNFNYTETNSVKNTSENDDLIDYLNNDHINDYSIDKICDNKHNNMIIVSAMIRLKEYFNEFTIFKNKLDHYSSIKSEKLKNKCNKFDEMRKRFSNYANELSNITYIDDFIDTNTDSFSLLNVKIINEMISEIDQIIVSILTSLENIVTNTKNQKELNIVIYQ